MKNESKLDRIIRVILAIILFVISKYALAGTLSVIAFVLGVIMLITAITGFCLFYKIFGINTIKNE